MGLSTLAQKFADLDSWQKLKKLYNSQQYHGVIVAASGGVDSTVLFHLLSELTKGQNFFPLALLHVNYRLRGDDSTADQRFCEDLAQRSDVPCHLKVVGDDERRRPGEGTQAWARRLRRAEFARFAADGWLIALGHHRDDLAENVLLRLARGASPGHLLGMQPWAPPLWRPLLAFPKSELLSYAAEHQLGYREDASNATDAYRRNVIRHRILPELEKLFPGAARRLVATAEEAAVLAGQSAQPTTSEPSGAAEQSMRPTACEPSGEAEQSVRPTACEPSGEAEQSVQPTASEPSGAAEQSERPPGCDPGLAPTLFSQGPTAAHPKPMLLGDTHRLALSELQGPLPAARQRLGRWLTPPSGPPRPLSRRFLDAALDPSARATSLPGGGRLVLTAQALHVDSAPQPAKEPRFEQHQRGLAYAPPATVLEPGSYASFSWRGGCYLLASGQGAGETPQAVNLCFRRVAAGKALRFALLNHSIKLKDLLSNWAIPKAQQAAFLTLERQGSLVALWDGRELRQPNAMGQQTGCSQSGPNLRYLEEGVFPRSASLNES